MHFSETQTFYITDMLFTLVMTHSERRRQTVLYGAVQVGFMMVMHERNKAREERETKEPATVGGKNWEETRTSVSWRVWSSALIYTHRP